LSSVVYATLGGTRAGAHSAGSAAHGRLCRIPDKNQHDWRVFCSWRGAPAAPKL